MKIELLDDKTVKVVLSNADMAQFNLTYDEMDYKNPDTKRVILQLVDQIKREVSIDLSTGKLFIEAFPYADGGCILYVNLLDSTQKNKQGCHKYKTSFDTPIAFCFKDINALADLSKRLISKYGHIILKNALYLEQDKYYLLIYTYFKMDEQLLHLLTEYGQFYGKGSLVSSIIQEHAQEIIATEALETLSECL
ncbi:adaptor protein MecA [Paludicola sp. MB14-C6]|uniref:adaptor protein MecA n=1 Tax=Paludihabitans sp. MB14-C6 TaxID=3070656 RepID=UPI0027DE93BA|nr:adaptor protein MecA [Paludicola sp. MB14-C6]WMJ23805.1 adaptor protein MecA [Paludicola sp. MB14-C6]